MCNIRQICPQVFHQRGDTRRTTCIKCSDLTRVFRKEKLEHVAGISCAGQLSKTVL
ncbi:hypothetical protein SMA01_4152 [Salmonella enterica subsp. enterica serovar Manhattan str. 111113]|nr:hypothetical protein SMA01_4152 [Salmonella enterica subsp. enterica serovar Manhattan str. 111113]